MHIIFFPSDSILLTVYSLTDCESVSECFFYVHLFVASSQFLCIELYVNFGSLSSSSRKEQKKIVNIIAASRENAF